MKIFILFLLSFSLLYFSGCSDEENNTPEYQEPYLRVQEDSIIIPSRGGYSEEFSVTSNTTWIIENSIDWCYVGTAGIGSGQIPIGGPQYDGKQRREAYLYFRTEDGLVRDTLKVIQEVYGTISFTIRTIAGRTWELNFKQLRDIVNDHNESDLLEYILPKNLTVNWGDGTEPGNSFFPKHTYNSSGVYTISISGDGIYCCLLSQSDDIPEIAVTSVTMKSPILKAMGIWVASNYENTIYECSIDFSNCPNLAHLQLHSHSIKGIFGIEKCSNLETINIWSKKLLGNGGLSVYLKDNTKLQYCEIMKSDYIEQIYLSNNNIEYLVCNNNNSLFRLDISGCTNLKYLSAYNSPLKILLHESCSSLREVNFARTKFTSESLNQIYQDLPQGRTWTSEDGSTQQSTIVIPTSTGSNLQIAKDKDWKVIES